MRVIFLSNYLTHHQKPLSDELYRILGDGNYFFVCTEDVEEERKKMGWPVLEAPYVVQYSDKTHDEVERLVDDCDVAIYGHAPLSLIKKRYYDGKIVVCNTERRYKTISRYFKYPINTYKSFYINKGYFLSSSAFAPKDYWLSGMSLRKCYKWGYFPEVKTYENIDALIEAKGGRIDASSDVSILWAGRLIEWKHPESVLFLAKRLKQAGYRFHVDIIGNGILEERLKTQVKKQELSDCVNFLGSMSPAEVRWNMEKADIFLFTSDRHEGWGAVVNESMNSACAVVASNAIGSVPYLIKNGYNGMIYQNGNNGDLYDKVKYLIDNPNERKVLQKNAYKTVHDVWSPSNASKNLISLFEALLKGGETPILDGPGSKAPLIWDKYLI